MRADGALRRLAKGRGEAYLRNARWFRDRVACRTVFLVWGNHDARTIRDLFNATYDQVEVRDSGVKLTLNHYPMLTWNGQHRGSVGEPPVGRLSRTRYGGGDVSASRRPTRAARSSNVW